MTTDEMRFWWQVAVTLISLAAALMAWFGRRSNVTNETIGGIQLSLAQVENRVTVVEQTQMHSPRAEDLTAIRAEMSRMATSVAEMGGNVRGEMSAMTRQLSLIQEHLLNTKK